MRYNLFATLLTEEAVDILVTNLFKNGYSLSPLDNNKYYEQTELSVLVSVELSSSVCNKDLILDVARILLTNKCSYLSLVVIYCGENSIETRWLPGKQYK